MDEFTIYRENPSQSSYGGGPQAEFVQFFAEGVGRSDPLRAGHDMKEIPALFFGFPGCGHGNNLL